MTKELKQILKICEKRGYVVKFSGGHYRVHLPNQKVVVMSATPSDVNAFRQILRHFKRCDHPIKI